MDSITALDSLLAQDNICLVSDAKRFGKICPVIPILGTQSLVVGLISVNAWHLMHPNWGVGVGCLCYSWKLWHMRCYALIHKTLKYDEDTMKQKDLRLPMAKDTHKMVIFALLLS